MVSQRQGTGPGRRTEPAPLSAAGVADALRPFGQSRMLPRAAYVDPAVFAWERRHFFGGGWLCAGRSDQLPNAGDQRAEDVGAGSVLLVRGDDGLLRAFANTCRHRGHELLPCGQTANAKAIVCPYHSWAYSLQGGLRAATGFRHQPGFDDADWGLAELPVTEWHGLVFVDGSGTAGPLAAALSELDPIVAPYEPERLVVAATHEYETTANWKILTENYHECYHCPAIHPELCKVSPPKSGENYTPDGPWVGGWMELRDGMDTMSLDGGSGGVPLRGLDARRRRTVEYVNVFPNILISLHPDYVMMHRLTAAGGGPDRDRVHLGVRARGPGSARVRPGVRGGLLGHHQPAGLGRLRVRAARPVLAAAPPGPLSPDEDGVYQFVTLVARGYQGQPVWDASTVIKAG